MRNDIHSLSRLDIDDDKAEGVGWLETAITIFAGAMAIICVSFIAVVMSLS